MGMPITPLCLSSPQYFSYLKIPVDCLKIRCIAAKAQSVAAIYRFSKPSEKEKQIPFLNIELFEMRLRLTNLTKRRHPLRGIIHYVLSDIRV